jgi:hypothetical protein
MMKSTNLRSILVATLAFAGLLNQAEAVTARVMHAYTSRASNLNGGAGNLQAKITNNMATCDRVHSNSQTWVDWDISRWYATGLGDQRPASQILSDTANHAGMRDGARNSSSNLICITADSTDYGGLAYQPGQVAMVDAESQHTAYPYYSHEMGHNYNADHGQCICTTATCTGERINTIMQLNYCAGGRTVGWYSNPAIYNYCRYLGDGSHNNAVRINNIRHTRSNSWF